MYDFTYCLKNMIANLRPIIQDIRKASLPIIYRMELNESLYFYQKLLESCRLSSWRGERVLG